jgi:archaellum component FlaD/FlaE/archaellum component FlaC
MLLVEPSPYFSIFFSFGVVAIGLASWLGGGEETDTEEIQDEDDEFAMDDDFGMDDFDDDFDDDFGGMGDVDEGTGGPNTTELENRIEDLESEIANVSSTANTVRSENEQISEKVDDVEENVRKLLEIYEMVTRGVNPFVDDVSAEAGLGGDGGSFGLFDDDEEPTNEADEDLDSDIADAEAEDFFDDDAFDDFDDEFDEEDEFAEEDEFGEEDLEGFEETGNGEELDDFDEMEDPALEEDTDTMEDDDGGGGGTSFEELKAEYESGEADWADEELEEGDSTESAAEPDEESIDEEDPDDEAADLFIEDDLTGDEMAEPDDGVGGDPSAMGSQAETEAPSASETVPADSAMDAGREDTASEQAGETAQTDATHEESGFQFGAAAVSADGDGPYLERPPDGYLSDVVMLEWLDFLVDAYDARNAVRAINYYERIGWIGEPMRDHCVEMVMGITDADYVYRDEFGTTDISMADHRRSLGYVEELAGGRLERSFANSLDTRESNGI